MSTFISLLAQQSQGNPLPGMLLMFLAFGMIFYFLVFRPSRKEQTKREEMLANLSKHDKVLTSGGIYGTVANIKEHQVVIKVDESSNTKLTIAKSHIVAVLESKKGGKAEKDKDREQEGAQEREPEKEAQA